MLEDGGGRHARRVLRLAVLAQRVVGEEAHSGALERPAAIALDFVRADARKVRQCDPRLQRNEARHWEKPAERMRPAGESISGRGGGDTVQKRERPDASLRPGLR